MPPAKQAVDRLIKALRLETPLIAVYDGADPAAFEPLVESAGHACCFSYYKRWLEGKTLSIEREEALKGAPCRGCPGGQRAMGLVKEYPSHMAHFLTDGEGAPMGEGLKASPDLAQDFLDRSRAPEVTGDRVLIGPLRLEAWETVKTVTFLVDPDRLSAVMTLATYWTSDPDTVHAPFSSGCGLLRREPESYGEGHAVIGCTDLAMRKYLPPALLCLTVLPGHFETMLTYPDSAFLNKEWWNELMKARGKG